MRKFWLVIVFALMGLFLFACTDPINPGPTDAQLLETAKTALSLPSLEVSDDYFILPHTFEHGITVVWTSNHANITIDGVYAFVTRELHDRTVVLTATLTKGETSVTKTFDVVVKGTFVPDPVEDVIITVKFNVTVPSNTPLDGIVSIAGSFGGDLPSWNPAAEWGIAEKQSVTTYTFEIVYTNPTLPLTIEYKWTRGNWDTVEKTAENEEVSNRTLTISGSQTLYIVNDTVEKWADLELANDLIITVNITVEVPANTPYEQDIVIAGSFGEGLPAWNPGDAWGKATRTSPTEATFQIVYTNPTLPITVEYKWTRGSWATVEKDAANDEISNRTFIITGDELVINVEDTVEKWVDMVPSEDFSIKIVFKVNVPANTPTEGIVSIAGSFGGDLPSWNPAAEWGVATRESMIEYAFEIEYLNPTLPFTIEYKWTRGSWETVEKDASNDEISNRTVTVTGNQGIIFVEDTVAKWVDLELSTDVIIVVKFEVLVPSNTPASDIISIAGSFGGDLPSWNPAAEWGQAEKLSATVHTFEITYINPTLPLTIEYKWTRGSWDNVEKDLENGEISNRSVTITGDQNIILVKDVVQKWADMDLPGDTIITVNFTINVPVNTPAEDKVYIAGSIGAGIPAWNPSAEEGETQRVSETQFTFQLVYTNPTLPFTIEYKFTRGSWDSVEKDLENGEISNRTLIINGTQEVINVEVTVLKWADIELPIIMTDAEKVAEAKQQLILAQTTVTENFNVPLTGAHGATIIWDTAATTVLAIAAGEITVTRPLHTVVVELNAAITINDITDTKVFSIKVLGTEPTQDELDVITAANALTVSSLANLTADRTLPHTATLDTTVSWTSSHPESIEILVDSETGVVTAKVNRLDNAVSNITLTATVSKNLASATKNFTASVRASAFTVTVTWYITIPEAIPNAVVITTGSSNNSWNPANLDYGIATKVNDTLYKFEKEFSSPNGTNIALQYKWTLQVPGAGFAAWSGEELTLDGVPVNNRNLTITRNTTEVEDTVLRWRIPVGGTAQSTVVGNLDIIPMTDNRLPSAYQTRNIRIWTPTGYDPENTSVTYPVIYMHDGQNVFDSVTSFAGEWGVDETISSLMSVGGFGGAIVVAIDNSADRMAEYTYNYSYLSGTKRGDIFMDFIVEIVKPYVDANYNTKPEREHTAMAGSSMGGLITFFGGLANLETFGILIPFSTSTQQVADGATNIPATLATLNATLLAQTKFFLYVGTSSDGNSAWPAAYQSYLLAAGVPEMNVQTYQGVGFTHNEYAWRVHFPMAIEWSFGLTANKAALQTVYDGLNHVQADYSANSWTVYDQAKSFAQTILAKENATLTEIVDAHGRLVSAISQLVLLSDMTLAAAVDDLIVLLPTVSAFNETHADALLAAQTAYNALSASQKKLVKFYYVINLLVDKQQSMVPAQNVIDLIAALPLRADLDVVTDKPAVVAARQAYDALTSIGKSLVTNYALLTGLEGKIQGTELKAMIDALPTVETLVFADKAQVDAAVAFYNATPTAVRSEFLVTADTTKLTNVNNKMQALVVDQMIINLLPVESLTLEQEAQVVAARTAYNALNATRKALVTQLANLTALEAKIVELKG